MIQKFLNRVQAGQMLAHRLEAYKNNMDVLVLALPRGGVPVAFEVATHLNVPLDVCIVRKLGVPGHKELAMGAIAGEKIIVLNQDIIDSLGIDQEQINQVINQELQELKRRDQVYRGHKPPVNVHNKIVIVIDDGIATGATIRAAIAILRRQQPKKIIVAVPIASLGIYEEFCLEVDDVVCLQSPKFISAIGWWYEDFTQTTDQEVRVLLGN
ncbi:MAG: phosphoribosyltransferase [Cuspidothrix sp.]